MPHRVHRLESTLMEAPQELWLPVLRTLIAWKQGRISNARFKRCLSIITRNWDKQPVKDRRVWLGSLTGVESVVFP